MPNDKKPIMEKQGNTGKVIEVNCFDYLDHKLKQVKNDLLLDQGPERLMEAKLKTLIEGEPINGICYKFVSPATTGVPDRIVVANGRTYFVEMKSTGKTLEPRQKVEHERLRKAGAYVVWIDRPSLLYKFVNLLKSLA